MRCAVDLYLNEETGDTEFRAICRDVNKIGSCPKLVNATENCIQECQSDSDCPCTFKCCYSGCGSSCLAPLPADEDHTTTVKPIPGSLLVPVAANISMDRTVYPIGGNISIPCDVDGYPIPTVQWFKDDKPLEQSARIQDSESHRIHITRSASSDTGVYRCEASNAYGTSSTSVSIVVEGVFVHPNCTDNPYFANCQLIVKFQYCTHQYYARFCCASCTLAGQLPSYGPHLERAAGNPRSQQRK